jgi:protein-tyrosine-phosphatase
MVLSSKVVAPLLTCAIAMLPDGRLKAQEVPVEYKTLLSTLGKTGDFKDGVLKVNIPRTDLHVTIGQRPAPTPFGFGGWVAMTKGTDGAEVLMGDLVLTEDEVNPVMSAILDNGLDVTALHNHFFHEQPRIFYMHVHGMGSAADLTRRLKPAIDVIDAAAKRAQPPPATAATDTATLDGPAIAKIVGHEGQQTGPVYKITIGRPDIDLREHGAVIGARMGLNTWAAFAGTDADAMVAGDIAMLEHEVTLVLRNLRASGIDVVAIHHHMTGVRPAVIFLHYYGTGSAATLAHAVRGAVDLLGKPPSSGVSAVRPPTVLFMCPHGAAKSVLASAYFQRVAKERGLNVRVLSAGTHPDPVVAPAVADHLSKHGYEVPISKPRLVTATDVSAADVVISLGCDLKDVAVPREKLVEWNEVPPPSENFDAADQAIRQRVVELVDELIRTGTTH